MTIAKTLLTSLLILLLTGGVFGQGANISTTVPTTSGGGTPRPALLYLPNEYGDSILKKYPVLIFLHGSAQSSATGDLSKIYTSSTSGGPSYFVAQNTWPVAGFTNPTDGKIYKFIIVSPQAASWGISAIELNYIIPYLVSTYRVDTNRIYLTGLSAGGNGVVEYCGHHNMSPRYKTPAWVPMSAALDINFLPAEVPNIIADSAHAWGFGDDPGDIHGIHTHNLIDSLNHRKPGFARFTNYTGGHCCWGQFYDPNYKEMINGQNINIYQWMLSYKRGVNTPGGNQAPTVNAGTDQSIVGSTTTLAATASDPDGTIASYSWTKVSGGTATIVSPTSATTNLSSLIAGSYQFRCMVTDNGGAQASDIVAVTVAPSGGSSKLVYVNIYTNSDPYTTAPPTWNNWSTASLIASNLLYSDGSSSIIDVVMSNQTTVGNNQTTYTGFTMCPDKVGQYYSYYDLPRTFTIKDLDNTKTYDLEFYCSRSGSSATDSFVVNSIIHTVPVGNNKATTVNYSGIYPTAGQIVVTLCKTATSNYNYINGFKITENTPGTTPPNQPPVASAGQDQTIVLPTSSVTLSGSGSTDDHNITTYLWTKISGTGGTITTPSSITTTFTGLTAGTYNIELAVTDDSSSTRRDTMKITVNSSTNSPPIAATNGNQTIRLPVDSVTLDGHTSTDADGTIINYLWSTVSGPVGQTGTIQKPKFAIPGGAAFTINPDGQGHRTINDASHTTYHPGDTIYLSGYFKAIDINNLQGSRSSYIVITNKPNETLIIGDSLWSGGSYAEALVFRNCHYVELAGTDKNHLQIVGSNSDSISSGASVRTAYFDLAVGNLSDNFAIHDLTIRNGGAGLWAKTEVSPTDPRTWYPYTKLNNWEFFNLDISHTYNEAMYIGHTATYWNIVSNTPAYPNPGDTYQNDTSVYKRPIKLDTAKIHDNYVHNIGNDGIQTSAIDNLEVYNNEVTRWATKHGFADNGGILIGGRVKGFYVHDNIVHDSWGELMQIYAEGGGLSLVQNNLFYLDSLDGVDIRGTNGLLVTLTSNTIAYTGGNAIRINGYFGGTGNNLIQKNIIAQPQIAGGTVSLNSYIYKENGGLANEPASPLDNKKFATAASVNWDEGNYFLPNTGSTAIGYGYIRNVVVGTGYVHTIISPSLAITKVKGLIQGTYVMRLTVTDNKGATGTSDATITVNPPSPPYWQSKKYGAKQFGY